jgi:nitrate reductase NapAB chaperone NapD
VTRDRVALAETDLAAIENVNLAASSPGALIVVIERLKGSLTDMIRLHHERDAN